MILILEVKSFNLAYAAIIESTCPDDGAMLERRPDWYFGFCVECKKGWQAGMGSTQNRYINTCYPNNMHWSENGMAYTDIGNESVPILPPIYNKI